MSQGTLSQAPLERRSLLNWLRGTSVGAFAVSALYAEYAVNLRADKIVVSRGAPA